MAVKFPLDYTYACSINRSNLAVRVIANNPDIYPDLVARTSTGWLVYDRFERQVLELSEDLGRVRNWGRVGPGPMEYERPVGLGRLDSARVVVIDASPPSLIVFGPDENEYRIGGVDPDHGMVVDGKVLISSRQATVHELTLEGEVRSLYARSDFGLQAVRGQGAPASPRLRAGHIGFRGPSSIWKLGAMPQRVVQRCLHDDLVDMLVEAPRVDLGSPFGVQPYHLVTMQDFLPLGSDGYLAIGGLVVRGQRLRSIERYDASGMLLQAWQLLGYPEVNAVFDEHNIGRLLVWNEDSIDGIQLVETEGMAGHGP